MADDDALTPEAVAEGFANAQTRVCKHMNDDHTMSLLAYVHYFGNKPDATSALLVSFDADAMTIEVTTFPAWLQTRLK